MTILELLKKKVVIFDGAMGTNLAGSETIHDSRSTIHDLVCCEAYNLYAPEAVLDIHKSFIDVGSDVIETNTFNANWVSLAEFGLADRTREINLQAVAIARKAMRGEKRPVVVAGVVGPTNRLPSMGQIGFDDLYAAYYEQIKALIEGGVDHIQIETCQDLLQARCAVVATKDLFGKLGECLPIIVSFTPDSSGRTLLGTEPGAILATMVPLGVDLVGVNCGLGPRGMEGPVRYLANHSPLPIIVQPNAGLPEIVDGRTEYNLGAEEFAESIEYFVKDLGVEVVGGCCGTTPAHLSAVVERLGKKRSKKRRAFWEPSLASLFGATTIRQRPAPLIVGERMNINGSKRFKKSMLADDFEAAAQMATEQQEAGAHAIDISVAYAGRDEIADICELLKVVVPKTTVPISIDSTNIEIVEAALKMIPGRPIINSINLEDGGEKAKGILALATRFGAAVVALTIDRDGMAKDVNRKCEIAERIIALCGEFGIGESALFIDPLTFTLAEPRAASYGSAAETLKAIKKIKKRHPEINTILGVSNVSYGFGRDARRILNSVFLHEAVGVGLDAAIVHSSQIVPLSELDEKTIGVATDLILRRKEDALDAFVRYFEGKKFRLGEVADNLSPEEGVKLCLLRGDRSKVTGFLDELVKEQGPQYILNKILLPAISEVGNRFDRGEIPLPFVLQSAEVMKAATDWLAARFEIRGVTKRGRIVLATVRGDVHDIGKNLVDIILSNNGFEVINLGVKQPTGNILRAVEENSAGVIGLSGLLVESALVMKEDLAELAHRGVDLPVICGGAALTKKFVEKELAKVYGGPVYYAADAFEGLKIVERIVSS